MPKSPLVRQEAQQMVCFSHFIAPRAATYCERIHRYNRTKRLWAQQCCIYLIIIKYIICTDKENKKVYEI